jgi:hypothetical protein
MPTRSADEQDTADEQELPGLARQDKLAPTNDMLVCGFFPPAGLCMDFGNPSKTLGHAN